MTMMRSSLQALGRQVLSKSLVNFSPATLNFAPKLLCNECKGSITPRMQYSTLPDDISLSATPSATSVKEYLAQHEISVSDPSAPDPILTFESSGLPDYLLTKLLKDFTAPTPIQAQGLPIALSGKNMVGIGQTGSGKTLAFLLPALLHIRAEQEKRQGTNKGRVEGPLALVVAPTRELAQQIEEVARDYRRIAQIRTVCCIGGENRGKQLSMYDNGAELMIGTPGRINDFLQSGDMKLNNVGFVVLDEADRMLDMGFEPQIRSILEVLQEKRQTMMFSATWPEEVQDLASEFLNEYTFMNIGSTELSANKNITQGVTVTTNDYKQENFLVDMEKLTNKKVLVFTERKSTVDRLERLLRNRRMKAMGIHGDKSQRMRSETIKRFKDGSCNVMIATDVAARGLDISGVEWVVNYDFPNDVENYIHRIGRTGRANKKGSSITYMTVDDARFARKLVAILKEANQEVPAELVDLQKQEHKGKAVKGRVGQRRDQGSYRQRSYSYRGTGDDGDEYGWDRYSSRGRGYGGRGGGSYGGRDGGMGRSTNKYGFEEDSYNQRSRGPGKRWDDEF